MYRVVTDPEASDQVDQLPLGALVEYAQVIDVLEITPWNGSPHNARNPDGAVRRWLFGPNGAGQVVYLILEPQQEVHVLLVQWAD